MSRLSVTTTFLVFYLTAMSAMASLPKAHRTLLPLPKQISDGDKLLIAEVMQLNVYQDSSDPNQYYYTPPFRIKQYLEGAAGMLLHPFKIRHYDQANKKIEAREQALNDYDAKEIEKLQLAFNEREAKQDAAVDAYQKALAGGNQQIIDLYREILEQKRENYQNAKSELEQAQEKLKKNEHLMPAAFLSSYNEGIAIPLALSGYDINLIQYIDPTAAFLRLLRAVAQFANTNSGYLTVNVYGGFSKGQLDALVEYKAKYAPHIKVSLLPIDKLTFFSLATPTSSANLTEVSTMFTTITGSGDYLGAAINLGVSVAGAVGLAQHLAPFIPPIGIKATYRQQLEPTEAELVCDFTAGFSVYGRADVRDGGEVFDNDVMTDMTASDSTRGGCNLIHHRGDKASAEYKALQALERQLDAISIYRTNLTFHEKEIYYNGVLDDIENNRRDSRSKYTESRESYSLFGYEKEDLVKHASAAADFHWYTNEQNVKNLSELKFTKKISVKNEEKIDKELPINLCLVFHKDTGSYDRCTEMDELDASNMVAAINEASSSEACKEALDPMDCGNRRDEVAPTREARASSLHDHHLRNEI